MEKLEAEAGKLARGDSLEARPLETWVWREIWPKVTLSQHCGPSKTSYRPGALAHWTMVPDTPPQSPSCEYQNVSNYCELSLSVHSPIPGISPLKVIKIRHYASEVRKLRMALG